MLDALDVIFLPSFLSIVMVDTCQSTFGTIADCIQSRLLLERNALEIATNIANCFSKVSVCF